MLLNLPQARRLRGVDMGVDEGGAACSVHLWVRVLFWELNLC